VRKFTRVPYGTTALLLAMGTIAMWHLLQLACTGSSGAYI
jgi:hypothetical protein